MPGLELETATQVQPDVGRHLVVVHRGKVVQGVLLAEEGHRGILPRSYSLPVAGLEGKQTGKCDAAPFIVGNRKRYRGIENMSAVELRREGYSVVYLFKRPVGLGQRIGYAPVKSLSVFLIEELDAPRGTRPDFDVVTPSRDGRAEKLACIGEIHQILHALVIGADRDAVFAEGGEQTGVELLRLFRGACRSGRDQQVHGPAEGNAFQGMVVLGRPVGRRFRRQPIRQVQPGQKSGFRIHAPFPGWVFRFVSRIDIQFAGGHE